MQTIGERIRRRLGVTKRTQTQLATYCGVSIPSVNDWISGKTTNISAVYFLKMCRFLKCDPNWMIDGVGMEEDIGHSSNEVRESSRYYGDTRIMQAIGILEALEREDRIEALGILQGFAITKKSNSDSANIPIQTRNSA
jgi:transcriptional regulator with XRE-family HTH domain